MENGAIVQEIVGKMAAMAKKNDASGWPVCRICGEKFFRLLPGGLCLDCDSVKKKPALKPPKKESVFERINRIYDQS